MIAPRHVEKFTGGILTYISTALAFSVFGCSLSTTRENGFYRHSEDASYLRLLVFRALSELQVTDQVEICGTVFAAPVRKQR